MIEKLLPGILATFPCLAITGPRQSGKSTLLHQVLADDRYDALFADAKSEAGFLLCLADGQRQISRGVTVIGVIEYLDTLKRMIVQ